VKIVAGAEAGGLGQVIGMRGALWPKMCWQEVLTDRGTCPSGPGLQTGANALSRVPALFTRQRPWMFPLVTNNGDLVKHEPGYLHAGVAC